MCLSPERMNVTCSSEGDDVELTLTLDNLLLMRTGGHSYSPSNRTPDMADSAAKQNESSTANVTISLNGQWTGNVACRVWNNVSRDETVIHLKSCKGTVFKGCLLFSKYQFKFSFFLFIKKKMNTQNRLFSGCIG